MGPSLRLAPAILLGAIFARPAQARDPGVSATPATPAGAANRPAVTSSPIAAPTLDPASVERLEKLGYLDTVPGPADPAKAGVIRKDPDRSWPGYDLYTNAHACSTDLLDPRGKKVHGWSLEPCFRWGNSVLLPNGDLLVVGQSKGSDDDDARASRDSYVARLAWDGSVLWKRAMPAHHDVQPTPRGEIVLLTTRTRNEPDLDPRLPVRDDHVTLLSREGEVLGDLSLLDALKSAPPPFHLLGGRKKKLLRDVLHANSVQWMPPELAGRGLLYAPSNILVCLRHQNAIAILDWETRRVLWTWGQDRLSGPHDAVLLPTGNVLVFDNGYDRESSRILEVDPSSGNVVWQYEASPPRTFKTQTRGSNQRLPNGNTLIAESDSGRAFEVTPGGEIVWEFLNPNFVDSERSAIVRIRRHERTQIESLLAARRAQSPASANGGR